MSETPDYDLLPTHVTAVSATETISPRVRRVTFSGGLDRLVPVGPDSFVYVLLPPPGRADLTIGTDFTWTAAYGMPQEERPVGAYYTIRHYRPDSSELDIDMVLHGDGTDLGGHASAWAARAAVGDPVALWGPRTTFQPPEDTEHYLLVADDTGLPATCAVVESLPAGVTARIVVEVADRTERRPLESAAELNVTWLERDGIEPGRSSALVDAVVGSGPLPSPGYVWGGAESRVMTAIRKHVRHVWGLPREHASLTPYWRHADSPMTVPEDDE